MRDMPMHSLAVTGGDVRNQIAPKQYAKWRMPMTWYRVARWMYWFQGMDALANPHSATPTAELAACRCRGPCTAAPCGTVTIAAAPASSGPSEPDRLLGLLGEAGDAIEHGEPRCRCCCCPAGSLTGGGRCCCCWTATIPPAAASAPSAAATAATAAAAWAAAAARRRWRWGYARWYCCTAATKSRNPNSGHSTSVKTSSAWRLCHSRKSERRVSPLVRTSRSTGGQPAVYSCCSSASMPPPLQLLLALLLPQLLLKGCCGCCCAARLSSAR